MRDVFKDKQVEDFANSAAGEQRKRGNPRKKKKTSMSFSVSKSVDGAITRSIRTCEDNGLYGVTRSDILEYAFECMAARNPEGYELVESIKRIKGIG